jgi:acyl-CoA reductase-like NAD-dependent aldehyde dehydrogenase
MKVDFIIDGEAVGAANGATYKRLDPVTGKIASEAAAAGPVDVDKVVEAAARSQVGRKPARTNAARCSTRRPTCSKAAPRNSPA